MLQHPDIQARRRRWAEDGESWSQCYDFLIFSQNCAKFFFQNLQTIHCFLRKVANYVFAEKWSKSPQKLNFKQVALV
jgi:hypothetical protein